MSFETKKKIRLFLATPHITDNDRFLAETYVIGVYASSNQSAALKFGKIMKTIEIEEGRILSNYDLNYEVDPEIIKSVYKDFNLNFEERDFEFINDCVLKEKIFLMNEAKINKIFKTRIGIDLLVLMMEIRGAIARKAGFDAIEMWDDFRGVYYIVVNVLKTLRLKGFSDKYLIRLTREDKSDLLIRGFSTLLDAINFSKKFSNDPEIKLKIEKK